MNTRRQPQRPRHIEADPLFADVERAADQAVREVLEEDRRLRELGIVPPNGRSR